MITSPAQNPADDTSWMDDLYVSSTPQAPQGGSPADAGGAPAPIPASPTAPATPAVSAPAGRPASFAPNIEDMVRAQVAQQLRNSQQAATPSVPTAPAPPQPTPAFDPSSITLSPEEQARLTSSGAGDLLEKVARRAIADYDKRVVSNYRRELEAEQQARRNIETEIQTVRTDASNRSLQARFPDLDTIRMRPEWVEFSQEPVNTPVGVVPRQTALGMAAQSGNYSYIDGELQMFRQKTQAAPQQQQQQQPTDPFSPQATGTPMTAGNPTLRFPGAPAGMSNPRAGVSGGAPAPSLAQLSPNRGIMSASKVQATLADLSQRIALNPRDVDAQKKYTTLSQAARTAYFEGKLV